MKKNSWIYITLGLVGVGLFFAYKKRNTPPPSPNTGEGTNSGIASTDIKKRKDLTIGEMQFSGSGIRSNSDPIYVKPTNLIPDVYGRYYNADGGKEYINTKSIGCACKSADARKNLPSPTFNVYA
jgi:hypothetical protein